MTREKPMDMKSDKKTVRVSGCALIAIGAWIALAPFIAGTWSWSWDVGRFLLTVLPGTAAVVGGLIMLGRRRALVSAGGGLALAGGLWLIVGPPIYALFAGPDLGTTPEGAAVRMLEMIPFCFGAGVFVSFVSAYAAGFITPLQFADEMWTTEPISPARARVPLPPERPRRQRGVREPARQPQAADPKGSARRDS